VRRLLGGAFLAVPRTRWTMGTGREQVFKKSYNHTVGRVRVRGSPIGRFLKFLEVLEKFCGGLWLL